MLIKERRKLEKRKKILKSVMMGMVSFCMFIPVVIIILKTTKAADLSRENLSVVTIDTATVYTDISDKCFPDIQKEKIEICTKKNKVKERRFDIPLDDNLQNHIFNEAEKYQVSAALIVAVIRQESNFNVSARSTSSDSGLMQVNDINMPELQEVLGITDIYNPYQNISAGTYLLARCLKQGEEINPALMAYNMGYKGAKDLWEQGIWSSEYSRSVYEYYLQYKEEID